MNGVRIAALALVVSQTAWAQDATDEQPQYARVIAEEAQPRCVGCNAGRYQEAVSALACKGCEAGRFQAEGACGGGSRRGFKVRFE